VPAPSVTMYSRTTCGLCDEARDVILAVRAETPFEYEEVFVDDRDELERAYGVRVPVVLVDGQERFELHVDPDELRRVVAGPGA
jgi:glutaredoxin